MERANHDDATVWLAANLEDFGESFSDPVAHAYQAQIAAIGLAGEGALAEQVLLDPGPYPTAAQQSVNLTAWPWSAVVLLTVTFPNGVGVGTGVMVGRNDVLTAGHVVYNPAFGGAATSVVATPAALPGPPFQAPYGAHFAQITYVDTAVDPEGDGLILAGDRGPGFVGSERDMAFLSLQAPVGYRTGWMALDPGFKQGYANLSGYPVTNGLLLTNDTAYAFDDPVDAFTNITYFEVHPGNSGGPLWHFDSSGRPAVVGLVSSINGSRGLAAYDIATNYNAILGWIASNDTLIA